MRGHNHKRDEHRDGRLNRGKFIVFEGGEGSGKTTQINRLYQWLSQHDALKMLQAKDIVAGVKLTREPGGTALGQQIRRLLLELPETGQAPIASTAELLLYAADRAQHLEEAILPWLDQGFWVLCDRFTDSTVAYQGYGRQLDLQLIETLNRIATGGFPPDPPGEFHTGLSTSSNTGFKSGLKSDLTLWLQVSPAVGLARASQRSGKDRLEQAGERFHQRVSEGFAALANPDHSSALASGPITVVDGDRSPDEVAADIQHIIEKHLAQWYPLL